MTRRRYREALALLAAYANDLDAALRFMGLDDDADLIAIRHDFYDYIQAAPGEAGDPQ